MVRASLSAAANPIFSTFELVSADSFYSDFSNKRQQILQVSAQYMSIQYQYVVLNLQYYKTSSNLAYEPKVTGLLNTNDAVW